MFLHGFDFEFSAASRAVMGDYAMEPSELVAELRAGANLARPELQSAMLGVLKASLIGVARGFGISSELAMKAAAILVAGSSKRRTAARLNR